ncbi:MAG: hypothetical protein IJV58_01485, partial [Oscillospiraceae bacterium]|nr:hypothetical protein [Oscillospiraceae bacterium]
MVSEGCHHALDLVVAAFMQADDGIVSGDVEGLCFGRKADGPVGKCDPGGECIRIAVLPFPGKADKVEFRDMAFR